MAIAVHVVLQQDVDNLGASGEVVRVRPGYARNYLIPRGLAVPATKANLARIEQLRRAAQGRAETQRAAAQQLAQRLQAASVKIARAVGEDEKMFGSVTARDIQEAFRAAGLEIDRKKIVLGAPIKELGAIEVPVKLHKDITAKLAVEVVKAADKKS